jgi:SAM-dependent methyltransferase
MSVDVSMFSAKDAFDIGLQRTAHFKSHLAFRLWAWGIPQPLRIEALLRKKGIVSGAIDDAEREFAQIAGYLGSRPIDRMVDIGCGHALIDLFFSRRFGCHVHVVDIETTASHHHDFRSAGSGYASLQAAQAFLTKNGVPAVSIQATNPQKSPLVDDNCDIIMSLLSCGFHYPTETYASFIKAALKPGGIFLFDMRKSSGQESFLTQFERYDILEDAPKYQRIAAIAKS